MTNPRINTVLFNEDQLELDTDLLTPAIVLVTDVQAAGRYRGHIGQADGSSKSFSLVVQGPPAEPSVNIDLSTEWTTDPTFNVAASGHVVLSIGHGAGGNTVRIFNDVSLLVDNTKLRKGQLLVLRLLRPGKHLLEDKTGGGTCTLMVQYPTTKPPVATQPVSLTVAKPAGTPNTTITPNNVVLSVAQPVVVTVDDGTHLVSTLQATTNLMAARPVTTDVVR